MYLMIGLGKIGLAVTNQLSALGHAVVGISRSPKAELSAKIEHLQLDARHLTIENLANFAEKIEKICITVTPTTSDAQGYQDSYLAISKTVCQIAKQLPNLQRVFFVSSTSVYGQNSAEIIDIDTPILPPTKANAKILLETEQLLQQTFAEKCTIIRPSGIYGKDRQYLVRLANDIANQRKELPDNTWTNRIFDTDLIQIMVNILTAKNPLPVYLATDESPAKLYDVIEYLSKVLIADDDYEISGKRLKNNLPKQWLKYPNWKMGYDKIHSHNMINMRNKKLRHPNVLTEAERLALPDPCRPLTEPTITNSQIISDLNLFNEILDDVNQEFNQKKSLQFEHFIAEQQQLNQQDGGQFRLSLDLLPQFIQDHSNHVWQKVLLKNPNCAFIQQGWQDGYLTKQIFDDLSNNIANMQTLLFLSQHFNPIMLSIFLLCQCKTRKTINHQINLQDLLDLINQYLEKNQQLLLFKIQYQHQSVNLAHLEFALLALNWQMSKHDNLAERSTNISSQNPLQP